MVETYCDEVYEDVKEAIFNGNYDYIFNDYLDEDGDIDFYNKELFDRIYDDLWLDDSVTGNGSGSYTFNRTQAKAYVINDLGSVGEAYESYGQMDALGEDFVNQDWEKMDVTTRCYFLQPALEEIFKNLKNRSLKYQI